ncbi:MAG: NADH-quinone oxidoreductase subunit NuoE [Chloroflexales bacterium]|nr:NADH-quinone oxidoreductase subunit NuoE [Chloroflexales bacterium]
MLRDTHRTEIDDLLTRYGSKRSAVLPLLYIAQDTYGHLTSEAIREVADILNLPDTDVFEVVGFYTLFYGQPVGKWVLQVCDDVPCCYLGAEEVLTALKEELNVREDQVTADGMFMVQRVKCLAACNRAPVIQANLDYIYDVTPDHVDTMLRKLRSRAAQGEALSSSGRWSEDYEFTESGLMQQIERRMGPMPDAPTAHTAPEAEKVARQEAASVAEESAQAATEARIAAESPVAPSPDRSPTGAHPAPAKQDDHGAVPAQAVQQETHVEQSNSAADSSAAESESNPTKASDQ